MHHELNVLVLSHLLKPTLSHFHFSISKLEEK